MDPDSWPRHWSGVVEYSTTVGLREVGGSGHHVQMAAVITSKVATVRARARVRGRCMTGSLLSVRARGARSGIRVPAANTGYDGSGHDQRRGQGERFGRCPEVFQARGQDRGRTDLVGAVDDERGGHEGVLVDVEDMGDGVTVCGGEFDEGVAVGAR